MEENTLLLMAHLRMVQELLFSKLNKLETQLGSRSLVDGYVELKEMMFM